MGENGKGIVKNDLLKFLSEYAASISSLTRYTQKGLILLPYTTKKYISDGSRKLYHPIVPLEFITAARLKQLYSIEAVDAGLGRIEALYETYCEGNIFDPFCKTFMGIGIEYSYKKYRLWKWKNSDTDIKLTMNDLAYWRDTIRSDITKEYSDNNQVLTDAYLKYVSEAYKHIFMNTYNEYWDSIVKNIVKEY